jgi:hypothetical protein
MRTAMHGDPFRALVELITNASDSYSRLEREGVTGDMIIEVLYRKHGSVCEFGVRDFAEGMTPDTVRVKFKKYGGEASDPLARGYFNQGAKDALAVMAQGRICTFRDNVYTECQLSIRSNKPWYGISEPAKATSALREQHGIKQNGTVAYFSLDRDIHGPVPQYGKVQERITNHFQLRKILASDRRRVLLCDCSNGTIARRRLHYAQPASDEVLRASLMVDGGKFGGVPVEVTVQRAHEELTQAKDDDRIGGLLVVDELDSVLDIGLYRYDHDPDAVRLFGEVRVGRFRDFLKAEEPVLREDRGGLDDAHPFCRSLVGAIEQQLARAVEEERKRKLREARANVDIEEARKYRRAFDMLNKIAEDEIQNAISLVRPGDDTPEIPSDGIGLYPASASITVGKRYAFQLRVDNQKVRSGAEVAITSTNPRIAVITPRVTVKPEPGQRVLRRFVTVEGREPNIDGKIRAQVDGFPQVEAKVHVEPEKELLLAEGLLFQPETVTLRPNQPRRVVLLVYVKIVEDGSSVSIKSDNESVHISVGQVDVRESDAVRHVAKYELDVWGDGAGQDALVTAACGHSMAVLEVKIRIKETPPPGGQRALFSEPFFDMTPEPQQRSSFSAETGKVIVYVRFPSVSLYLGDERQHAKTLPAQVLTADLVAETCFREIARRRVEASGVVVRAESLEDKIRQEAYELSRKYGRKVHQVLVDQSMLAESRRANAERAPASQGGST